VHKRKDFGKFLNRLGLLGAGAEVGVQRGEFAAEILGAWEGRMLHLIDPWAQQPASIYEDIANVGPDAQEQNFREAIERLAPFAGRFNVIRATSAEAAGRFADGSLDFVYIDANHSQAAVTDDLQRWFGKVREGGIVAGHDYLEGTCGPTRFGVQTAVDAFVREHRLDLQITNEWPTWFARKRVRPALGPQDICVLTAFDAAYRNLGAHSVPNKQAYCARHGYHLVVETDGFDLSRPAAWSKMIFVRRQLAAHEWVFWSDADSLIVNESVRLEEFIDPEFDMIVTREDIGVGKPHINIGVFFMRRSAWSLEFLDRIYAQTQFIHDGIWENAAFLHLLEQEDLSDHIKIVPQRRFNSYPANFKAGDFLLHLPAMPTEQRLRWMQQFGRPRFRRGLRNAGVRIGA
jgi:hypothetical protein